MLSLEFADHQYDISEFVYIISNEEFSQPFHKRVTCLLKDTNINAIGDDLRDDFKGDFRITGDDVVYDFSNYCVENLQLTVSEINDELASVYFTQSLKTTIE